MSRLTSASPFRGRGCLAACVMAAIAMPAFAQQERIPVSKDIWAFYKEYEASAAGARAGFFAIAVDGSYAASIYCPDTRCRDSGELKRKVVSHCEDKSGVDCIVFAQNRDIKVAYDLIDE
jgi:hypothetical protein